MTSDCSNINHIYKIDNIQNITKCIFCNEDFVFDGDPYSIILKCPYCYHQFFYVYCNLCNKCISVKGADRTKGNIKCHNVYLANRFCSTCDEWKLWDLNLLKNDSFYKELSFSFDYKNDVCDCRERFQPNEDKDPYFLKFNTYPLKNKYNTKNVIYIEEICISLEDLYFGKVISSCVKGQAFSLKLGELNLNQFDDIISFIFRNHKFGKYFYDKCDIIFQIKIDNPVYKIDRYDLIYHMDISKIKFIHTLLKSSYDLIKIKNTYNFTNEYSLLLPSGENISFVIDLPTLLTIILLNYQMIINNKGLLNHSTNCHGNLRIIISDKDNYIKYMKIILGCMFLYLFIYVLINVHNVDLNESNIQ